jgi:hypothetical protein
MKSFWFISTALLSGFFDEFHEPVALFGADTFLPRDKVGSEGVFEGTSEKGLEDPIERGAPGFFLRLFREVNHFAALFAAAQVTLFFKDVHHAAHSHGGGGIGENFGDLIHRGFAASEEDIHDLAFAAAEF